MIELPRDESTPDTWHVCPVLGLAGDREHRLATWHPDHRCWAGQQPATIERGFQTTVCTTDGYTACPVYASWAWGSIGGDGTDGVDGAGPAPAPLEPAGAAPSGGRGRRAGRVTGYAARGLVIVGVVVAALAVVVGIGYVTGAVPLRLGAAVATPAPNAAPSLPGSTLQVSTAAPAPAPTPRPTPASTPASMASAMAGPSSTPAPSPTATPVPSPTATPVPSPTATPVPTPRIYVVKSGDTLISIAAEFGVTVRAIEKLNTIEDPSVIHVGQRIRIPPP